VSLQIAEYAHQLVRAGEVTAENGVVTARERLDDLIADRLRAAEHVFFVATSAAHDALRVGWVWLSPAPQFLGAGRGRMRWLSQLTVDELYRNRGWGRAMLDAVEHHAAALGVEEIWLRVFDWNVVARRLYESGGYELVNKFATDAHLRKRLYFPSRR
jgi:ribosomal protein S18 acetylase RimI-like enzyme